MRIFRQSLTAAALAAGFATVALAQTTPGPRDPNMPSPQSTIPEKIKPDSDATGSVGATGGSGENLSDRLERSGGVLQPPGNIDPGITAPAPVPDPGTTPVIRPPGTTGGNPTIQPR